MVREIAQAMEREQGHDREPNPDRDPFAAIAAAL
jgi:hypothetical protein